LKIGLRAHIFKFSAEIKYYSQLLPAPSFLNLHAQLAEMTKLSYSLLPHCTLPPLPPPLHHHCSKRRIREGECYKKNLVLKSSRTPGKFVLEIYFKNAFWKVLYMLQKVCS